MSLYNTSEFLTLLKQNLGIRDLPLPVSDEELLTRFRLSALKEFSVRYPRIEQITLTESERVSPSLTGMDTRMVYKIPKKYYEGSNIITVVSVDVSRPYGYSDYYVPQVGMYGDPSAMLMTIGDVKIAASMAQTMGKSMTFMFREPNEITLFNGWAGGTYYAVIGLEHDISLSTIPNGAFTNLLELALYDMQEYLYGKLKRMDGLDVGIGNIQLKIDEWQEGARNKKDLLKDWDDNGANLDIDTIKYF